MAESFDLATEVAQRLSDEGFGGLSSDSDPRVVAGEEPPEPQDLVSVLNAVGGRTVSTFGEEHVFEIRVRSGSYETAFRTARQVSSLLTERGTEGQGNFGTIQVARLTSNAPATSLGRNEGPAGGSWRTSQFFTALVKAYSFTASN